MHSDRRRFGPFKDGVKGLLVGRYADWQIEPAMRYLPIVRQLRRRSCDTGVTEIGSGSLGIAPYLREAVVGVDTGFETPTHPLLAAVQGTALELPFESRSRKCVISTDMLEHIPDADRQRAVDELVRIAGRLLILAVPTGEGAEGQDRELDQLWTTEHGTPNPFLAEHVSNGLPTVSDLKALVESALARDGREATVLYLRNSNLRIRMWLMRIWVETSRPTKYWTWVGLNWLHPVLSRMNFGECYRTLSVVQFEEGPDSHIVANLT